MRLTRLSILLCLTALALPAAATAAPAEPFFPRAGNRGYDVQRYHAALVYPLWEKIGTPAMLEVLRRWVAEHRYGSADTREFIALAEQVSGKELDPLFQRWLFQRGKPR